MNGTFLALDAASGDLRWSVDIDGAMPSSNSAAIIDGFVYVVAGGYLNALGNPASTR